MNKSILILGAGKSQLPLIKEAKRQGFYIIVVDINPEAVGIESSDFFINKSTHEPNAIIDEIIKHEFESSLTAVIARASDKTLITQAVIGEKLNINVLPNLYANLAIDKKELKKFCLKHDIPVIEDIDGSAPKEEDFPLVLKPNSPKVGKESVLRINDLSDFPSKIALSKENSWDKDYILEKYIDGTDLGVLVSVADEFKKTTLIFEELINENDNHFIGKGYRYPTKVKAEIINKIESYINKFLTEWKKGNEFILFSFKVKETSLFLYEVNYGLGGDQLAELFLPNLSINFNPFEFYIKFMENYIEANPFNSANGVILFEDKVYKKDLPLRVKRFLENRDI